VTPIDQMTEDEVRHYLAECLGWVRINKGSVPIEVPLWERRTKLPSGGVGVEESWCCPIFASLDAAAGCLPDGWSWFCLDFGEYGKCVARAMRGNELANSYVCDTERLARFRAAAKAWAVVRKESGR
jgi:hypothetical protein